ncbi:MULTISPECIES: LysR family transcriptional regulator [Paraburkholderia]|uniref:LysR family transcriptional regulator n=1 Tax=Paraburkholderia TaxID=1822464 RepID=UPI002256BA3B|nr:MULTISPECIES: LysR family transcriptional regulator [Paraburkholderia]MCX4163780.1 LysR family transcriptional regulator [Paraburkholderia megapolitana]MDN7159275.1 LysR family transcriptional regulator [Paraburkholderia sp. CHISQ3]MDQ6496322.1 LysR family transcriptional regulator [Paraburkholderia megapolitana]
MIAARLLNQFIAVAEELHFGRAAARLHMAQPPLSQAIQNLEEIVGVALFARSRHFVALTPAGKVFLDEARALLAQGQQAIDAARRANEGVSGRVAVGFVGSVSYELLPRMLRQFRIRFPTIHIDLRELTSVEQIENLRTGKIDIGILRLPINDAADLNVRTIEVERFIAVIPRDHRLAAAQTIRLEDLADDAFMTFPPDRVPSLHAKFLLACEAAGFSPRIALEAWQMASMVSLVAAGIGVVLLPAQVRTSPHPGVVYKDLANDSDHFQLRIAAAWRSNDVSPNVQSLLAVLDSHITD